MGRRSPEGLIKTIKLFKVFYKHFEGLLLREVLLKVHLGKWSLQRLYREKTSERFIAWDYLVFFSVDTAY